jgi:predicted DNA-binding protein (UPF0251 family)
MGRDKLKRNLQFKPLCKIFTTKECESDETIHLLHEELEALYLMDAQELYQAAAAEKMNVSRPTFARILKSARQKVTMMLITGANLHVEDIKEDYTVLIPSYKKEHIAIGKPDAPFLFLYHINSHTIVKKEVLENPVFTESLRPGQILPRLSNMYGVNFFVAQSIGVGLKSALLSKGVYSIVKHQFTQKSLFSIVSQKNIKNQIKEV